MTPSDDPPSPCVRRCTLDAAGARCVGCRRTLAEIMGWRDMEPAAKRAVLARLAAARPEDGNRR